VVDCFFIPTPTSIQIHLVPFAQYYSHFSVKNATIHCSFTFTAIENRKSHLQLSNLQCCLFDIVILKVAIIKKCSKFPPSAWTQADRRRLHSSMAWFTTSTTGCSFNGSRWSQSLQKVLHTTLAPLLVRKFLN